MSGGGGVQAPPGFVPPGMGTVGALGARQARYSFNRMVNGISTIKQIMDHVERDPMNSKTYTKEIANASLEMFKRMGTMFEQEHLSFIAMIAAAGGTGGQGTQSNK